MKNIYSRIKLPLAWFFFALAVLVLIDFSLPRRHAIETIERVWEDNGKSGKHRNMDYFFETPAHYFRVSKELAMSCLVGDTVLVKKSALLRRPFSVEHYRTKSLMVFFVPPFSLFPLFPLLWLLPLFLFSREKESTVLFVARPLSLLFAFVAFILFI